MNIHVDDKVAGEESTFSFEKLKDYFLKEHRNLGAFLTLFLLGLLAYSRSFQAEFQYNDYSLIVNNPFIKHLNLPVLWQNDKARFIPNLTYALNYFLGGFRPMGWHILNFLIHFGSSCFVYLIIQLTLSSPKFKNHFSETQQYIIAFFTSLVFLSHPIQTQTVIYTAHRDFLLGSFFYLGGLYCFLRARLMYSFRYYTGSLIFVFLATLSHLTIITLPLVILLFMQLLIEKDSKTHWARFLFFLSFFLWVMVVPVLLFGNQRLNIEAVGTYTWITPSSYLLSLLNGVMMYLRLLFLPVYQNLDYDFKIVSSLSEFPTYFSLIGILFIIALALRVMKVERLLTIGVIWFFMTLNYQTNNFSALDIVSEDRIYLASFGFSILLSIALFRVIKNWTRYLTVMVGIIAIFATLTFLRATLWSDTRGLLQDAIAKSPNKARTYNSLGFYYFQEGDFLKAEGEYQKAIRLDKNYFAAYADLGMVYLEENKLKEAEEIFRKLIQQRPRYSQAHTGLGHVLEKSNNESSAFQSFTDAIFLDPLDTNAYIGLGNVYQKWGLSREAELQFQKAVSLKPESAPAYYNLGNVYFALGDYYEAILSYQKAASLKPDLAKAYNNLGCIYAYYFRDHPSAMREYQKAIDANPSLAEAYFNLANTLYEIGRTSESKVAAKKAIELYRKQGKETMAKQIEGKLANIGN